MPRSLSLTCSLASALLASGCFNPSPIDDPLPTSSSTTGDSDGGSGETDSATASVGSTTDPDDTGPTSNGDPDCGNGVIDEGEDCDDMGESETCDADCTPAECGDMTINPTAMEGCDDGNLDDTDDCVACTPAVCGDGFVWAGNEDCDDGNIQNADACTSMCTSAVCGDGVVWNAGSGTEDCDDMGESSTCDGDCTTAECGDMVLNMLAGELCDDGNADDTDDCVGCLNAACGDGFVQAMIEECDDGNLLSGDGCDDQCVDENPLNPNVLRCGNSSRDVASFFPPMSGLNLVVGCTPDMDTQAIVITRSGVNLYIPAELVAFVNGGGIVLTEYSASDEVFSDLFVNVVQGASFGACQDRAPIVFQYSPADPFWTDNPFNPILLNDTGCGLDVAAYPRDHPACGLERHGRVDRLPRSRCRSHVDHRLRLAGSRDTRARPDLRRHQQLDGRKSSPWTVVTARTCRAGATDAYRSWWGSSTAPGLASAASAARRRYQPGSTPHSLALSTRL